MTLPRELEQSVMSLAARPLHTAAGSVNPRETQGILSDIGWAIKETYWDLTGGAPSVKGGGKTIIAADYDPVTGCGANGLCAGDPWPSAPEPFEG